MNADDKYASREINQGTNQVDQARDKDGADKDVGNGDGEKESNL